MRTVSQNFVSKAVGRKFVREGCLSFASWPPLSATLAKKHREKSGVARLGTWVCSDMCVAIFRLQMCYSVQHVVHFLQSNYFSAFVAVKCAVVLEHKGLITFAKDLNFNCLIVA